MRNPENILNSLTVHSKDLKYKYERLYRILFNKEMYVIAYDNIHPKPGNMTPGNDGETIDDVNVKKIEQLIDTLRNETYQPQPSRRVYIPKKNGKKRPLGIPAIMDKLLQEVVRMILEAIYESSFENSSHGFRPERSCHTALLDIQKSFISTKWFIEGDIKGFFDNINHEVLINIMRERIADERFIRLIRKFLNAGYIEDWKYNKTYSGTPQGGIISPILANIYLDQFDKRMAEYKAGFDKGIRRKRNPDALKLSVRKSRLSRKLAGTTDKTERESLIAEIKAIIEKRRSLNFSDEMDAGMRRIRYVRYADDFLIGVIGDKEDCKQIKEDIKSYLKDILGLELSEEKTLITHAGKPARFLGYDIFVRHSNETRRDKNRNPVRSYSNKVILHVPTDVIKKKLLEYKAMYIAQRSRTETWQPCARRYLRNMDDLEILSTFNAEITGFYNYYSIANNVRSLGSFYYIMEYSMYKTYACKYDTNKADIIRRYTRNKEFIVSYIGKKGDIHYRRFYNQGFKRRRLPHKNCEDNTPRTIIYSNNTTGLMNRLQAGKCALCASTENLEIHHVRRLKDLKDKEIWEKLMIARRRKTLVVCEDCHRKIHAGKAD